jgi:hypothetical protein
MEGNGHDAFAAVSSSELVRKEDIPLFGGLETGSIGGDDVSVPSCSGHIAWQSQASCVPQAIPSPG